MRGRAIDIDDLPADGDAIIHELLSRGSYDDNYPLDPAQAHKLSVDAYREWFDAFPENVRKRLIRSWQEPGRDTKEPWRDSSDYLFAALELDNAIIALQPPRGYGMNPDAIYHTPDLPPTHHYTAFYRWLAAPQIRRRMGRRRHRSRGQAWHARMAARQRHRTFGECFPDLLLGDMPLDLSVHH